MFNLVKKVQNTIFQYNLFKRGAKIVLAVSGGPDSVCMLDILAKLAPKYGLKLIIAHINYGLRGRDSGADEKLVRNLAKKYNLEILVLNAKNKIKKNRTENHLRDVRYDFFEKIKKKNNFDLIVVAHNADDQAETYLMRLIRGSGLQGLSAMQFKNGKIIRPLLETSRKEILEYLKRNKLDWRLDKTNLESKFLRNKIRNKLIPYLEKNFNPAIKKTIFNSSLSVMQDYDLISELIRKKSEKIKEMKISKLLKLHPSLQKGILREAISKIKTNLKDISSAHIGEILKVIKSSKNKNQTVKFRGLKIVRRGDKLEISLK
jgi:tRNA(Ile)-lysidine synthase